MYESPRIVLTAVDAGNPQGHLAQRVRSADLRLEALDLDRVRKFRQHQLRDRVESDRCAIAVMRRGPLKLLYHLVPAMREATEWVTECDVVVSGVQRLVALGISLRDRVE